MKKHYYFNYKTESRFGDGFILSAVKPTGL